MKKLFLFLLLPFYISPAGAQSILPAETDWTERFILSEQKELRTDLEKLRREITIQIQQKELSAIDRALSYSENTLNFFFVFLSIILMGLGLIGWKTISDAKKNIHENMEKEIKKVIGGFQAKIKKLEQEQEVNILWRRYYSSESAPERLEILKQIEDLAGSSEGIDIELSNIYLELESFDKVLELCDRILQKNFDIPLALYNRAISLCEQGDADRATEDLKHLLKISPDYQENILSEPRFEGLLEGVFG